MNDHTSIPHRADPRVIQLLCGILGVVLALGLLMAIHLNSARVGSEDSDAPD